MATVGRNSPCPCGSGARYKDCCGQLPAVGGEDEKTTSRADLASLMQQALAAQQAISPHDAERLYRKALAIAPDEPDALHMLGVLRLERGDSLEAAHLILRALDLTDWQHETYVHNLGLVLSHAYRDRADRDLIDGRERMQRLPNRGDAVLLRSRVVAVVMPCYNHERYVRRALESVFAQSHRDIELVVIDDGSQDATAEIAQQTLVRSPFPYQFIKRENRGAAETINEGIGLSSAPYINVLNSDDWFAPNRLEVMLASVAGQGAEWGFSDILVVDEADRPVAGADNERASVLAAMIDLIPERATVGFAFVMDNVAISSGNVLFSRALYERIGKFRDLRYNHDWDFCLRALRIAEPVFVPLKGYGYRLHGTNTIADAMHGGGRQEADEFIRQYIDWAMAAQNSENPIAPTARNWGMQFLCSMLGRGFASLFDPAFLRQLTLELGGASSEKTSTQRLAMGR